MRLNSATLVALASGPLLVAAQNACGCNGQADTLGCLSRLFDGEANSQNINFTFKDGKKTTGKASVEFECTSSNCVMTTTTSHIHTDKYEPVRAEITTCKIRKDLSFACVAIFSGQLTWDIPPEDHHLGRRQAKAAANRIDVLVPEADGKSYGKCSCDGEELKCSLKEGAFGEGIDVKGPVKKCDRVCSLPPSKVVISRRDSLYVETARRLAETVYCKNLYAVRDNPIVDGMYQSAYILVEKNVAAAISEILELRAASPLRKKKNN